MTMEEVEHGGGGGVCERAAEAQEDWRALLRQRYSYHNHIPAESRALESEFATQSSEFASQSQSLTVAEGLSDTSIE